MTEQTQSTPPHFAPVPAIPIVVLPSPAGVRVVRAAGGLFAGATFSKAIDAAIRKEGNRG